MILGVSSRCGLLSGSIWRFWGVYLDEALHLDDEALHPDDSGGPF